MIKQKEIYLVNFAKKYNSEFGKIRPAVVMQHNFLNKTIEQNFYNSVTVVPLTTSVIGKDYRVSIKARDNLKEDSQCVANWICTLDVSRLLIEKGVITTLSDNEFLELKEKVCSLF
jgi:mRNA interferase MazF